MAAQAEEKWSQAQVQAENEAKSLEKRHQAELSNLQERIKLLVRIVKLLPPHTYCYHPEYRHCLILVFKCNDLNGWFTPKLKLS